MIGILWDGSERLIKHQNDMWLRTGIVMPDQYLFCNRIVMTYRCTNKPLHLPTIHQCKSLSLPSKHVVATTDVQYNIFLKNLSQFPGTSYRDIFIASDLAGCRICVMPPTQFDSCILHSGVHSKVYLRKHIFVKRY